jgi:hypothetical protein
MRDTTTPGDLAEIEIAAALMRSGRRVLRPLSNGLRYDLVVDNNDGIVHARAVQERCAQEWWGRISYL